MSMKSTCARGTMMSRTCISETVRAPSMIDIASASSRFREYAERRSCTSCSRSPGSRRMNAESRSSRLGREGSFMSAFSFYRVGICETEPAQDANFVSLHALGIPFPFVIMAHQVQHAVHHQVRVVMSDGFTLRTRLARDHRMAKHDIAGLSAIG